MLSDACYAYMAVTITVNQHRLFRQNKQNVGGTGNLGSLRASSIISNRIQKTQLLGKLFDLFLCSYET